MDPNARCDDGVLSVCVIRSCSRWQVSLGFEPWWRLFTDMPDLSLLGGQNIVGNEEWHTSGSTVDRDVYLFEGDSLCSSGFA